MNHCSLKHEPIHFFEPPCPLCAGLKELGKLRDELQRLREELQVMREQLNGLEEIAEGYLQ